MKLKMLYETFGSGAIAMRPAALGGSPVIPNEPKKDEKNKRWYLNFAKVPHTNMHERQYLKQMLLLLSGIPFSGKTTFLDLLLSKFEDELSPYSRIDP